MKLNVKKFEKALINEQNQLVRFFNRAYVGSTLRGTEAVKASVMQGQIDVYSHIIEALQQAMEDD